MPQSYSTRNDAWTRTKKVLPIGTRVLCRVKEHHPFGVLTVIEGITFDGLIEIVSFRDPAGAAIGSPGTGRIEYPPVGSEVEAVVLGYRDVEPRQIGLGVRPSQLARGVKEDGSNIVRRVLPVGVRSVAGEGIEFFGIQEINKLLECDSTVVAIQEGNVTMMKSSTEEGVEELHLSCFTINVVVDSKTGTKKNYNQEIKWKV